MCGIAGIVNLNNKQKLDNKANIEKMIQLMNHRGPDSQGFYIKNNVSLGHARLRIIDLNKRADQPFISNDGSVALVFNGEIYNYKELKQKLDNYKYKTNCDTEVIIAAYEKWGFDCAKYFVGMFGFYLYDFKRNAGFCARDQAGIKPFYYFFDKSNFVFSSEIKGFRPAIGKFKANYDIISNYLHKIDYENKNETFFSNIYQLLPGQQLILKDGKINKTFYHRITFSKKKRDNASLSDIKAKIYKSVERQLQSDVPIGLFYSGGIDSTVLAAAIKKLSSHEKMQSYTFVTEKIPQTEINVISKIAGELGLNNKLITGDFSNNSSFVKKMMWKTESPFIPSVLLDEAMNSAAKADGITVVLRGDGGDEIFAGYPWYFIPFLNDCLKNYNFQNFINNYKNPPEKFSNNLLGTIIKEFGIKNFQLIKQIKKYIKYNMGQDISKYFTKKIDGIVNYQFYDYREYKITKSNLFNSQYKDYYSKMQNVLRIKDRISMSYSRELRVPLLDTELADYIFTLPDHRKIKNKQFKNLLVSSFKDEIPNDSYKTIKNKLLKNKVKSQAKNILVENCINVLNTDQSRDRGLFKFKDQKLFTEKKYLNSSQLRIDLFKLSQVELLHQVFID